MLLDGVRMCFFLCQVVFYVVRLVYLHNTL
jgi:hypothetical protein